MGCCTSSSSGDVPPPHALLGDGSTAPSLLLNALPTQPSALKRTSSYVVATARWPPVDLADEVAADKPPTEGSMVANLLLVSRPAPLLPVVALEDEGCPLSLTATSRASDVADSPRSVSVHPPHVPSCSAAAAAAPSGLLLPVHVLATHDDADVAQRSDPLLSATDSMFGGTASALNSARQPDDALRSGRGSGSGSSCTSATSSPRSSLSRRVSFADGTKLEDEPVRMSGRRPRRARRW